MLKHYNRKAINEGNRAQKPSAQATYILERSKAIELLKRITNKIQVQESTSQEDINWGHVGDMTAIKATLQELSDRMFQEGEYAAG